MNYDKIVLIKNFSFFKIKYLLNSRFSKNKNGNSNNNINNNKQ